MRKPKRTKFYKLNPKKHGIGGLSRDPLGVRVKEDRRAKPKDFYAVVFFPQYKGVKKMLGGAQVDFFSVRDTISNTPKLARDKFMDRIHKDCTWEQYQKAGHRVRRIRITDCGNAKIS